MIKKYIAIEHKNSKYCKGVPYISKKEFKKNKNNLIVGKTKLKKYKSSSENKNLDLLLFNNKEFEIKERLFGFKKGYVFVGDDKYIALKRRIPFLFLLLLLLIVFIMFRFLIPCSNQEDKPIVVPVQKEVITPEDNEDKETIKEEINVEKPNKVKPSSKQELSKEYKITFDSNGGYGSMESIICKLDNICILNENKYTKEGYSFQGWSTKNNGVAEFQDKAELKNLSSKNGDNITLYAVWEIKSYQITFLDYDKSIIQQDKLEYNSKIILPENPTRKGYTFKNWDKELSTVKENLTINALYDIDSYDISYKLNDGILDEAPINYNVESKDIIIPSPKKDGYSFIGWTTPDNKEPIIDYKILTGSVDNIELEANYDANIYNLIFNSKDNNDSLIKRKIKFDSEYGTLPEVEKDGYSFIGWTTPDNKEPIIDYKILTGSVDNIELEANYDANIYNLIFNSKDNNDSLIKRKIKFDSEYGTLPEVEKDGYTFNGWKNSNGDFVSSDTLYNVPEDTNLYAEWNLITYDIKYNLNGGTLDKAPTNYNVESEDIIIPSPKKDGYSFIGWATPDNKEPKIDYKISTGSIGDKELTANYEPITYYISYNSSEGQGEMEKQEFAYNQTSKLNKNQFTKEGYTFIGWSTSIDGDVMYNDESEISNLSSKDKDVITLYAKWEIIKLNVKYYDLFGALLKSETVEYGKKSVAPEDMFIDGYTFEGWNPSLDVIREDTIYKAQYTINEYTIKYNFNTCSNDDGQEIKYNVESDTITLPTPTRTGYTFLGWTGSNGLKPQLEVIIHKGSIGDKTYKANWVSNSYKVSLNANGGVVNEDYIMISYNSLYGTIPTPTRVGYTFEGWYYNDTLITEDSIQDKEFDHELVANWKTIQYDITYNLAGGTASPLQTSYNIESDSFVLPIPTRTGYTFTGWTGTDLSSLSKNVTINKGTIGNRSYTANWTINYYTVNYYVNGSLWATRSVAYNTALENLDAQSVLDIYHKFNYWEGWVDKMPTNTVNLYANITESYCMLMTGHGPYKNAEGLLNVFKSAGWTGRIEEAPSAPGFYWVVTDYTLTRAQADIQRDYIANHTNYTSYNYPYLYWVAVSCTNGIGDTWTRSVGTKQFTSQYQ